MDNKFYKYCAVPLCHNTTIKTPQKLFIYVPTHKERRQQWYRLARREKPPIAKNVYFCEDHFDLPNDMENFMEYHITGSVSQIRMKPDSLPTKFVCQPDRKHTSDMSSQSSDKKQRKSLIEECIKKYEERNQGLVTQRCDEDSKVAPGCSEQQKTEVLKINRGVQVNIRTKYRSKCTQTPSIFQHTKQTSPIRISITSASSTSQFPNILRKTKCKRKTIL